MQVNALVAFKFIAQPVNNPLVKIIAAQMGIAGGRFNLEGTFAYIQDGDIESAAAEVINCDDFIFLFIQSISQRSCGRLIDDSQHI